MHPIANLTEDQFRRIAKIPIDYRDSVFQTWFGPAPATCRLRSVSIYQLEVVGSGGYRLEAEDATLAV